MSSTLMEGAEVDYDARPGGLLATALPAPAGWAQGLSIPFYGCGEPQLVDRCVSSHDEESHRTAVAEFFPFGIQQTASCSSLSRLDQEKHARGRLDSTTEWGVGRQFATDGLALGTPSLADATEVGTVDDANFALAVAALEQAAANAGFGSMWWLHAPPAAAAFLSKDRLLLDGHSPTGAPWVISAGYPIGAGSLPGPANVILRLWATGPVWASVDEPLTFGALDRRNNEDEAYAQRQAIVAFDPCINLYVDVSIDIT